MSERVELPMFPLGTVLFPTMVMPLHVFEPRYRILARRCVDGDGELGVVLIERGSEVGGGDIRCMVGTRARLLQAVELDDGRWILGLVGVERIRVHQWLPDDPFPRAEVDPFPGEPAGPRAADQRDDLERTLRRVLALKAELGEGAPATVDLVLDPDPASGRLAGGNAGPARAVRRPAGAGDGAGRRAGRPGALPPPGRGSRACAAGRRGIGTGMATRSTKHQTNGQQPKAATKAASDGGFLSDVQDLWQLVVAYFKQETIEPIKGLGRFVGFGLAGSLAVGLGGVLLVLGLLRLLQSETGDAFDGNLSVFPYLISLVVAVAAAVLAVTAGSRDRRKS